NGNKKVTNGSVLTYGTLNGKLVPVAFDELVENNGTLTYRNVKEITSVNGAGRITEFQGLDGITTSLRWGYNNEFPVVQAVNAKEKDIHYESFEESGGATDDNSKTGLKVRNSSYSIS